MRRRHCTAYAQAHERARDPGGDDEPAPSAADSRNRGGDEDRPSRSRDRARIRRSILPGRARRLLRRCHAAAGPAPRRTILRDRGTARSNAHQRRQGAPQGRSRPHRHRVRHGRDRGQPRRHARRSPDRRADHGHRSGRDGGGVAHPARDGVRGDRCQPRVPGEEDPPLEPGRALPRRSRCGDRRARLGPKGGSGARSVRREAAALL